VPLNDVGATGVEYGLIVAMVSIMIAGGAGLLGSRLSSTYGSVSCALAAAAGQPCASAAGVGTSTSDRQVAWTWNNAHAAETIAVLNAGVGTMGAQGSLGVVSVASGSATLEKSPYAIRVTPIDRSQPTVISFTYQATGGGMATGHLTVTY
jgi:Flp pilus assembly pilin Flp